MALEFFGFSIGRAAKKSEEDRRNERNDPRSYKHRNCKAST